MSKLKVLDLFSGIGGFSLGLERTGGFKTECFVEIDQDCRNVLKKHWPEVPIYIDVKKVHAILKDLQGLWLNKTIDVITGGYPCTGHSVAGKKEGLKNEGSGLWREFHRLIGEIKPKYVIIENSHNLRSTGLERVLQDLDAVGYNAEFSIISAYSVGAPHQRERIYIVAWRKDIPYCDPFRSWSTYSAKKETKQEWWPKRRFERDPVFLEAGKAMSQGSINIDGLPRDVVRLNEEKIKQLGNSLVPQIPEQIGLAILENEGLL